MSTTPAALSLPDLVRGLILESGISQQEAAQRAGVGPGAVAMLCTRTPKPLLTWAAQIAALATGLEVAWQDRTYRIALPRVALNGVAREWQAWRKRRVATTLNHLRRAEPRANRAQLQARAATYAGNEEERLRLRLDGVRQTAAALAGQHRADGLRATVRLLTVRVGCNAEELTLLSGTSLSSCQLALGDGGDGRLATLHRLLSALGARLRVVLPAGRIELPLCPPGDWRPGMAEEPDRHDEHDEKPLIGLLVHGLPRNRATLDSAAMLALFDQGLSIGEIARQAGVSRQRVHKLAMDNGRQHRRLATSAERVVQGRAVLGSGSADN